MSRTIVNPAELHDPGPFGYSHTARISSATELVFVSGQYGSNAEGAVVSSEFSEQVRHTFRNLGVALAAHGLELRHVLQLRTYVVDHDFDKLATITEVIKASWDDQPPTQTLVGVAGLATPEILFEVEAVAARS